MSSGRIIGRGPAQQTVAVGSALARLPFPFLARDDVVKPAIHYEMNQAKVGRGLITDRHLECGGVGLCAGGDLAERQQFVQGQAVCPRRLCIAQKLAEWTALVDRVLGSWCGGYRPAIRCLSLSQQLLNCGLPLSLCFFLHLRPACLHSRHFLRGLSFLLLLPGFDLGI